MRPAPNAPASFLRRLPEPGPPGSPSSGSDRFNPWWIVGGVVVGGLIAVLVGRQIFGDPGPANPPTPPTLPPGGGMPPTTQLSIDPPPSPPRQAGGGTSGGGTTVQALRRGFDLPPAGAPILDNECILDIPASVSTATLDAIAARHAMTRLETVDIRLTGRTAASLASRRRRLGRRHDPGGLASEPDGRGHAGDFLFTLSQTAPAQINGDQYAPEKLSLPEAHRLATGNRVLIAVIDSEVDASHPDLAGAVTANFDATGQGQAARARHRHGRSDRGAAHRAGDRAAGRAAHRATRSPPSTREAEGTTFSILKGLDWAASRARASSI